MQRRHRRICQRDGRAVLSRVGRYHFGRLGEKGIFILPLDGYNHIGTARNYLCQMNRLTGEAWISEQQKDKTDSPLVTLDLLEPGDTSLSAYLANESGRKYRRDRPTDLDVCALIDNYYVPSLGYGSVYQLSDGQKSRILRDLKFEHRLPEDQIRRGLVL